MHKMNVKITANILARSSRCSDQELYKFGSLPDYPRTFLRLKMVLNAPIKTRRHIIADNINKYCPI